MNGFDLSTIQNCCVGGTQASAIYYCSTLIWPTSHDYSRDYLTIISLEDNNEIGWKASRENCFRTISISINNGDTWSSYTSSTSGTSLCTLNYGEKIIIKGNNFNYGGLDSINQSTSISYTNYFTSTKNFRVEGNIMSLIYEDNFINQTTLINNRTFSGLFSNCEYLIIAKNLILPATILTEECYSGLFSNCKNLINSPALPATTLADYSYEHMFQNCTSLINPPSLPGTTLAKSCYQYMFQNCKSLRTAPELPARILVERSYAHMFDNCWYLNSITCHATDISAESCLVYWTYMVASTGTFYKDSTLTYPTGANGIPSGWTIENI